APAAQSSLARVESLAIYWPSWNWLGAQIARYSIIDVGRARERRQAREALRRTETAASAPRTKHLSRLNTQPMRTPVNASPASSRVSAAPLRIAARRPFVSVCHC